MAKPTRPPGPNLTPRQELAAPSGNGAVTPQPRNSYVPEEAAPHTVRVRPSAWSAFEAALRRADLKKGPAVDALVALFAAGRIDVKLVRDEIKRVRGVDVDEAAP